MYVFAARYLQRTDILSLTDTLASALADTFRVSVA